MRFLVFLSFLVIGLPSFAALRVTIDPGHGGEDKGAIHYQVHESDVALAVGKKLLRHLKKDPLFRAQILRKSDQTLSLEQRVKRSEQFKTELFISIHANAHTNNKAQGAEFYIENQLPAEEEALFLAHNEVSTHDNHNERIKPLNDVESILADMNKTSRIISSYQVSSYLRKNWSQKKAKAIRQGPFYVLNQSSVPAVLVEVGYLTHPQERARLIKSSEQNRIAKKIHNALRDYAKNMDKLPTGILKPQNAKTR